MTAVTIATRVLEASATRAVATVTAAPAKVVTGAPEAALHPTTATPAPASLVRLPLLLHPNPTTATATAGAVAGVACATARALDDLTGLEITILGTAVNWRALVASKGVAMATTAIGPAKQFSAVKPLLVL